MSSFDSQRPTITTGLMWSHCRTTSGAFAPQYWHGKGSRRTARGSV